MDTPKNNFQLQPSSPISQFLRKNITDKGSNAVAVQTNVFKGILGILKTIL